MVEDAAGAFASAMYALQTRVSGGNNVWFVERVGGGAAEATKPAQTELAIPRHRTDDRD